MTSKTDSAQQQWQWVNKQVHRYSKSGQNVLGLPYVWEGCGCKGLCGGGFYSSDLTQRSICQ
jgi:hypothetical protein